jgi:hypothetical protein
MNATDYDDAPQATFLPDPPPPAPPRLQLHVVALATIDRALLMGDAHIAEADPLAFLVKVGTAETTGEELHDFLSEVRGEALRPLYDLRFEMARQGKIAQADALDARVAEAEEKAAKAGRAAETALARARDALVAGDKDPAKCERVAREARIEQEVLENRVRALTELAASARKEGVRALGEALEAKRDELFRAALTRAAEARQRLAEAMAAPLAELLRANAEAKRLAPPSPFERSKDIGVLAGQIAAGEDLDRPRPYDRLGHQAVAPAMSLYG